MWKVLPALAAQWDKMYQLSLFGAATTKIEAATVDGDLTTGEQMEYLLSSYTLTITFIYRPHSVKNGVSD
jgi:hypothetical protein